MRALSSQYCTHMSKANLVYILSLRNAAADKAGQHVDYKGGRRYMASPLEYLAKALDESSLGQAYSLEGVIFDDDHDSPRDRAALRDYGFRQQAGHPWFIPADLKTQGKDVNGMLHAVPSTYRRLAQGDPARVPGKQQFERQLRDKLASLKADIVVLDGLLIILDELVRPGQPFQGKIMNIHPGITRLESPYVRRGAYATLDALHGAQGRKIIDWSTMESVPVEPLRMTGASFHHVDNGIDSGEVIADVLQTPIDPEDTILELRWNNFNNSLFPALHQGLAVLAGLP